MTSTLLIKVQHRCGSVWGYHTVCLVKYRGEQDSIFGGYWCRACDRIFDADGTYARLYGAQPNVIDFPG